MSRKGMGGFWRTSNETSGLSLRPGSRRPSRPLQGSHSGRGPRARPTRCRTTALSGASTGPKARSDGGAVSCFNETRSAQPSDALTREPAWGSRLSGTSTMYSGTYEPSTP
jgi:hypothetical protein